MKKFSILLAVALLCGGASSAFAADFGDLLARLNSRDFSLERDVVTGKGGVYVGELVNPHSETPMFKARDEFRAKIAEAQKANDEAAIDDLCAFIADAMKADVSVETKVWLLEQLGVIGTDKHVEIAAALLKNDAQRIVDAAAGALAKIPGDAAQKALEENKAIPACASALLVRQTAPISFDCVENVKPFAISNLPKADVDEFLKDFDSFDDWKKDQTLAGLTARADKSYREYALKALKSENPELQRGGFLALEKMATAEDAPIFVEWLKKDRNLAIRLAGFVEADGFDDALLAAFEKATDAQEFGDLATILAKRAVDVRPLIFAKTTAANCADRLALLEKVATIATAADDAANLVATVVRFPRGKERDAAENVVAKLCNKDATPLLALKNAYPVAILYPIVARTGGDVAKAEIEKALDSTDPATQGAALAALNVWADAQFAAKMESILNDARYAPAQKVAVLRAYIRVISLPDGEIGIEITRDEKLAKLKAAYKGASRVDEKRLVLSRLKANRNEKSFEFAIECAADPQVAEAAYSAIVDHAHDSVIRKQFPELTAKGLTLVIEKSKDAKLVERAKVYQGRMQ